MMFGVLKEGNLTPQIPHLTEDMCKKKPKGACQCIRNTQSLF